MPRKSPIVRPICIRDGPEERYGRRTRSAQMQISFPMTGRGFHRRYPAAALRFIDASTEGGIGARRALVTVAIPPSSGLIRARTGGARVPTERADESQPRGSSSFDAYAVLFRTVIAD